MRITWLGHGSWRIEIGGKTLLIDPWFSGNSTFPEDRRAEALEGATHILITHGHGDHTADAPDLAKELGIPVLCIAELGGWWSAKHGIETVGFNKGGTVDLDGAKVTMVTASHSSSVSTDGGPVYTGTESGFMIAGEGHVIYFSGDTDIMADMGWMGEYYRPDIGILSAGGFFTMDMKAAAWAAKKYFAFETVFPSHWKTFGALEQSADALVAGLPGVDVKTPDVLEPVEIAAR
ncbi:metal-dependent hydrolase [Pseudoroseicyclus aestuarii]|uniref:L-ascorbate metabolism protein UlaG (Beta-lactamase superfamily) n=1 Tax=Pseudoroseicyclus aestuarii TaxID=1795041 RepID=A0A318T5L6_9RHOB|nr:metal-dependent hydrolase [Pseudoroseicyclus aestuarii]PYE85684.1 L-ascorbate metabolism protein UlaG (beta-lactamase superfamily) [Pseudoroseicyclus aestuarii]